MGKRFSHLLSFIAVILMGTNCSPNQEVYISYSFNRPGMVYGLWLNLFAHTDEAYLNYIYSDTCYHCLTIKDKMEDFANNSVIPIYFVEFTEDIPIGIDTDLTIGLTSIDGCFIKGTPSLILIENGAICFNIAGTEKILETIDLYRE